MKLITFAVNSVPNALRRIGALVGTEIVDFTAELSCKDMKSFLEGGNETIQLATNLYSQG